MEFNLASVFRSIAGGIGSRSSIVYQDRSYTFAETDERTDALARHFRTNGLGLSPIPREELRPWESGQDHLGIVLYNCNEYLETMLGSFKARLAPFNINYRSTASELAYLLANSRARALVFHSTFRDTVFEALAQTAHNVPVLLQVADDTDVQLLDGAVWFEQAVVGSDYQTALPNDELSPDDLNIIYTGGTTGLPKGVLWRQADAFVTSLAGRRKDHSEFQSLDEVVERASQGARSILPACPFMHGGGQVPAFQKWHRGGTVVIPSNTSRLDAADIWSTVSTHGVGELMIVGNAFAVPLIEELRRNRGQYDLDDLSTIFSGGAALSENNKQALLQLLTHVRVIDAIGSTESGPMGTSLRRSGSSSHRAGSPAAFAAGEDTVLLTADRSGVLPRSSSRDIGWLARTGRVALGYLDDPERTAAVFPTIKGTRHLVLGDRARYGAEGTIEFLGRDESVINTGGEKVYANEVEDVLEQHPDVQGTIVLGRPHPRWGSEVCAIVALRDGAVVRPEELDAFLRKDLSGYKIPRRFLFEPTIQLTPVGKKDVAWARRVVGASE